MSTKTIYERIALISVTRLGAGFLAVVPAKAANGRDTAIAISRTTEDDDVDLEDGKFTSDPIRDTN